MRDEILKDLYKPFENLSERQGMGGMIFKYVPNKDIITRMNKVFKGCWSSHIMHKEVMEDQVLVEAQVTIKDPDSTETYTQTGFGSSPITRFTSGPKQGKIIELSNAYKGALSKAIANACKRWGVGLMEDYDDSATPAANPPVVGTPAQTVEKPKPAAPVMPTVVQTQPAPPVQEPVVETPPVQPVVQPTVVEKPPVREMPPIPPIAASVPEPPKQEPAPTPPVVESTTVVQPTVPLPNQTVGASVVVEQAPPEPAPTPEMPKIPEPATDAIPPTPNLPFVQETLGDISNVQRVALNGILSMNNIKYEDLATEAFQARGINKPVPPKEKLEYADAVIVIKYGNDKYRKR